MQGLLLQIMSWPYSGLVTSWGGYCPSWVAIRQYYVDSHGLHAEHEVVQCCHGAGQSSSHVGPARQLDALNDLEQCNLINSICCISLLPRVSNYAASLEADCRTCGC